MFKSSKEEVSNTLGISLEAMDEFLKRQKGFLLKREKISAKNLMDSYAILSEIKKREEQEEAKKVTNVTKNILILKYAKEITDLYQAGLGSVRISKSLKLNHNVNVSKASVERFIKDSHLKRSL